jgi:hypothetical protein
MLWIPAYAILTEPGGCLTALSSRPNQSANGEPVYFGVFEDSSNDLPSVSDHAGILGDSRHGPSNFLETIGGSHKIPQAARRFMQFDWFMATRALAVLLALSDALKFFLSGSNGGKHREQSNLRKESARGRKNYSPRGRVYFRLTFFLGVVLAVFACTSSSGFFPRGGYEGPTNAYAIPKKPTETISDDIVETARQDPPEAYLDRSGTLPARSDSSRCGSEYGRAQSLSSRHFPGPWDAVFSLRFAALTPATAIGACAYNATHPPDAPIIKSVRSDEDGSLTVEFNTPAGTPVAWQEAMVMDGTNQSMWHYDSVHWTSAELLDDGVNKKSEYFNRVANQIKVEVHYGGSVRSVVWSHNLGKSLQQIFALDEFVASDIPEKDWHDVLGEGVAGADTEWVLQGFNARYITYHYPLGEKLGMRLGIYMSSLIFPTPNAMIGVGLQALETYMSGDADRADLAPAAGAHCAYSSSGDCTSHTATKVVVYVDDGACVNYHITTNPPTPATIVSSSPAMVTGLQLTSAYAVEVRAVNTAGASSAASAHGTSKPCRCSCNFPKAAAITSIDSHQTGTVTAYFDVPADMPANCTLDYTLRASPGDAVAHVSASPATLTGLDTSRVSYTIDITASNLLGSGPTSFKTAGVLSSANNDGWDGLAKFVAIVQPGSAASFVLGPGVLNASHPIDIVNIDITIRGSTAGGTVLDARKLSRFFRVRQRGILRLYGPLTLANGTGVAIEANGRSKVFARGVAFTKCDGKAIWAVDARVEVLDCNFTDNVAGEAAAIHAYYTCTPYSSADDDEDLHVLSITKSRFERNAAPTSRIVRSFRNVLSWSCCCLMCCALQPHRGHY